MNSVWWFLHGYWIVELTGASPDWALNRLTQLRIPFWSVRWLDDFTVRLHLFPRDLHAAETAAEKAMCRLNTVEETGLRELLRGVWKRPCLWISLLAGLIMVLTVPKFVLFYEIEGNQSIPDSVIARGLDELGIRFGEYGPSIKSQWVEDHMLNLVEGLEWVTVNQSGCKAIVEVRERPSTPVVTDRRGFSNIVAARDGIIERQSVWTGQKLKEVGDVVVQGELLVSGVVDLERTFLLTRAQAEIYARTWRDYRAVTPVACLRKGGTKGSQTSLWLEIGKRRIKIFGNSGISTVACDKMINRKILSLPGGNELPVSVLVETYVAPELETGQLDAEQAQAILADTVRSTAMRDMLAGEILRLDMNALTDSGGHWLNAALECREMIAETVEVNWVKEDFEHD